MLVVIGLFFALAAAQQGNNGNGHGNGHGPPGTTGFAFRTPEFATFQPSVPDGFENINAESFSDVFEPSYYCYETNAPTYPPSSYPDHTGTATEHSGETTSPYEDPMCRYFTQQCRDNQMMCTGDLPAGEWHCVRDCTKEYYQCLADIVDCHEARTAREQELTGCAAACPDPMYCYEDYYSYEPTITGDLETVTTYPADYTTTDHVYAPTPPPYTDSGETTTDYGSTDYETATTDYDATVDSSTTATQTNWWETTTTDEYATATTAPYDDGSNAWTTAWQDTFYLPSTGAIAWGTTAATTLWETTWDASMAWTEYTTQLWSGAPSTALPETAVSSALFHRIAIATRAVTNSGWKNKLSLVLGLSLGEIRDAEVFRSRDGSPNRMFVFSLSDQSRICQVAGALNALPWRTAERLAIGGVEMVHRRPEYQYRLDNPPSDGAGASTVAVSALVATLSIVLAALY